MFGATTLSFGGVLALGLLACGCQQGGHGVRGVLGPAIQVRYDADLAKPLDQGTLKGLRVARVMVAEGDPWAPERRGDAVKEAREQETSDEAAWAEREAPLRIIEPGELRDRAGWLEAVLEDGAVGVFLQTGETGAVSQTRDFVYPRRFKASSAGWLHQTLSTETLGSQMDLKVRMVAETEGEVPEALGLEIDYRDTEVAGFLRHQERQFLPVFVRESVSASVTLGGGRALLVGGQRVPLEGLSGRPPAWWQVAKRWKAEGRRPYLRWLIWFEAMEEDPQQETVPPPHGEGPSAPELGTDGSL